MYLGPIVRKLGLKIGHELSGFGGQGIRMPGSKEENVIPHLPELRVLLIDDAVCPGKDQQIGEDQADVTTGQRRADMFSCWIGMSTGGDGLLFS